MIRAREEQADRGSQSMSDIDDTTVVEVRWYTLDGTCLPLLITPVFMLFVLVMGNLWFKRRWPRAAPDQSPASWRSV